MDSWHKTAPLYLSDQHNWILYPPRSANLDQVKDKPKSRQPSKEEILLSDNLLKMKRDYQKTILDSKDNKDNNLDSTLTAAKKWMELNKNLFDNPKKYDDLFIKTDGSREIDVNHLNNLYGHPSIPSEKLYESVHLNDHIPILAQDIEDIEVWNNHIKRVLGAEYDEIQSEASILETLALHSSMLPGVIHEKMLYSNYLSAYAESLLGKTKPEEISEVWVHQKQFKTDEQLLEETGVMKNEFCHVFNQNCPNDIVYQDFKDIKNSSPLLVYCPINKRYYPIDYSKDSINDD